MRKTAKVVHVVELDEADTHLLEGIFSDWADSARNYANPADYQLKDSLIGEFHTLLSQPLSESEKTKAHDAIERG